MNDGKFSHFNTEKHSLRNQTGDQTTKSYNIKLELKRDRFRFVTFRYDSSRA